MLKRDMSLAREISFCLDDTVESNGVLAGLQQPIAHANGLCAARATEAGTSAPNAVLKAARAQRRAVTPVTLPRAQPLPREARECGCFNR